MKKKCMLIIIVFMVVTNLISCNINQVNQEKSILLSGEEIDKFAIKNKMKIFDSQTDDNGYIITYERENEYGVMQLYRDESPDGIGCIKGDIDSTNQPNELVYVQITGIKDNHIALFIRDEELRQRAEDIAVEFEDKESADEPFMISQTMNKGKSVVISYENHGQLRNIKRIIIRDESGNDIYTIE